jgi:hypothetical protein
LLRKGGPSANATAFNIVFGSDFDCVPIKPMVLVEARVLRGNDGVLQIGRDLAERNECVAFVARRVVYPGLQAALDMYGGCRRVDPPGGHKGQRGKQPKKRPSDDQPSDRRLKKTPPRRGLGVNFQIFFHFSE